MDKKITVHKLGEEEKPEPKKKALKSILKKTSKIKLKGVRDPSTTRKHTIRLMTSKGHRRHDKTLKKKIGSLTEQKVTEITKNAGLIKNSDMPLHLKRQILGAAISSGFVSDSNIN
jgi:hypothetical protein